jgi:hypothetical protein
LLITKNDAIVASIKSDVKTSTNSIISYYLINGQIKDISDAISLDLSKWEKNSNINNSKDLSFVFKTNNKQECLRMEIDDLNSTSFRVLLANDKSNNNSLCSQLRKSYNVEDINKTINSDISEYLVVFKTILD